MDLALLAVYCVIDSSCVLRMVLVFTAEKTDIKTGKNLLVQCSRKKKVSGLRKGFLVRNGRATVCYHFTQCTDPF